MSAVEKLDLLHPLVQQLQGVAGEGEIGAEGGGDTGAGRSGGGANEDGGDALAALAACELISEFVNSSVGAQLLEPRIDEIHSALIQICKADEVAALFNSICEAWERSEEHVPVEMAEGYFDALTTYARSTHGSRLLLHPRRHVITFVLKHAFGGSGPHPSLHTASLHALASVFGADRVEGSEPVQMVPVHGTHSGISGVDEGKDPEGGGGGGMGVDLEVGGDGESKLKEETFAAAAKAPGGPTLAVYRLLAVVVEREWAAVELCGDWTLVQLVTDAQAERHKTAMDWRHSCCVAMATAAEAQHASISFNCSAQPKRCAGDLT
ncbi:hypothetical protein CLOP_g3854 [Closterium sp. NIES-67]|nr:hypothetical protein CLOP_g3854 [Closterium sp. NIES-67]